MTEKEQRPNSERILSRLKDFQRQSVEYIYRRLYEDSDKVNRFLIADEVGLGKTLVAKGVIAKAVDRLWDEVERIDIVYICANQDIASQNINRINITPDRKSGVATRMTLLPVHLHEFQDRKLNFVSFTPGTSFDLRSSSGIADERALLYCMLREGDFFGSEAGPKNLFQCGVGKDKWRDVIRELTPDEIDPGLAEAFRSELRKDQGIVADLKELTGKFSHYRYRKNIPREERQQRDKLVADLRRILAQSCVRALEPDIVIMDEFQRFKYLLDNDPENEVARLAQALFNFKDEKAGNAKTLLLSATPYKMYTMYNESQGDNHYEDFVQTIGFLFNSGEETKVFENELENYRKELYRITSGSMEQFSHSKNAVEKRLRNVMVRTERLSVSADRNGMLVESKDDLGRLTPDDLKAFAAVDQLATVLEAGDPLEYWKSVPYLLNLMDDSYEIKRKLMERIGAKGLSRDFADALGKAASRLLSWGEINSYKKIDPANAKLRTLLGQTVERGAWKLLWIPPSLPYYQVTDGPYVEAPLTNFSKALVFSSWQAVPKVIATLCSYEAEREMMSSSEPDAKYEERKKRKGLINFTFSDERPSGMANFTLMYPCLSFAYLIDPLEICARSAHNGSAPSLEQATQIISGKVRELIAPFVDKAQGESSRTDERWYWAILAMLDAKHFGKTVSNWFETESNDLVWGNMVESRGDDESDSKFKDHVALFKEFFYEEKHDLGKPPEDLVEVLTKVVLASPAITAVRSLARCCLGPQQVGQSDNVHLLAAAARVALGLRSLFNQPDSITMIRSLRLLDESRFWENALNYCVNGNLQSVMDEYVHILRESLGLVDVGPEKALREISEKIQESASLRTVSLVFDEFQLVGENQIESKKCRLRCSFALRFGDEKNEEGKEVARKELARTAFNSPFKPFVLATTSVGQEGLDFHQYCHEVYHWNLPPNPVDLEQREGRIHRYKGHAVRRNIAQVYPLSTLAGKTTLKDDPWAILFSLAKSDHKGETDLIPYWIFEAPDGCKIVRHVPALPMSRELDRLIHLKKSLALYRMVFGQPRQEDLLNYLLAHVPEAEIEKITSDLRIDLSPPTVS
jgi:hypothetical protein